MDILNTGASTALITGGSSGIGLQVDVLVNNAGMFFMEYLGPQNLRKALRRLASKTIWG